MDELYLDNIDEYVNDQDKIVTYKWLSLTLGVHVNTAKQMLYHYLDHKRQEGSAKLHATYLVSGRFVDKGQTSHRVSVVREDQLEDCKAKMSLVVSVHVYSVQKALLRDSSPLYSVDYDAVRDHLQNCARHSAICCPSAVPLSSLELQQARELQSAVTQPPVVKVSSMNGDVGPASKLSTKPQKGIMGMFSNKSAPKNQGSVPEVKLEPKEEAQPAIEPAKSKAAAKVSSTLNFFGNQTTKKPHKTEDKAGEALQSSSRLEQQHQSSPPQKEPEAAAEESTKGRKKDSRSKTKRTEDSDSEVEKMDKKKRRRIKKPEPDSSSSSSDEDVIPDSPRPEPAPPTPPQREVEPVPRPLVGGTKTRKRRRVLKPKTFVDDEGCIVTEKAYESESYSEAEDQAPNKGAAAAASNREGEKKSQKKISANTNRGTKQASIMGFFQKK